MFSELPKLFDRDFAVAYFLPVSLFLAASAWLLKSVDYWSRIISKLTGNILFDASLAIFIAWSGGILLMALNWWLSLRATSTAAVWGDYVKSAFDLYRFNLIESLGINPPANREKEKEMWTKFSQVIVFRRPDLLPTLSKEKKRTSSQKKTTDLVK